MHADEQGPLPEGGGPFALRVGRVAEGATAPSLPGRHPLAGVSVLGASALGLMAAPKALVTSALSSNEV